MFVERVHSTKHSDSIVFHDVGWRFYKAVLRELDGQPSRSSYDRGTLEVMTLSIEHERLKMMIGEMIGILATLFQLDIARGGSATLKRFAKKKGLEADLCYWFRNAAAVRSKTRIDLRVDPPPDLVVEIDVTHAAVNRTNIYRSLNVPELWVLKRKTGLTAHRLRDRKWERIEHSLSLPFLRVADLNPFVARIGVDNESPLLADFGQWAKTLQS
jgi:Uma2 family endonuclease